MEREKMYELVAELLNEDVLNLPTEKATGNEIEDYKRRMLDGYLLSKNTTHQDYHLPKVISKYTRQLGATTLMFRDCVADNMFLLVKDMNHKKSTAECLSSLPDFEGVEVDSYLIAPNELTVRGYVAFGRRILIDNSVSLLEYIHYMYRYDFTSFNERVVGGLVTKY